MNISSLPKFNNISFVSKWRWWLVALSTLIVVFIETVEHKWAGAWHIDDYISEVILYAIILVLTQALILIVAERAAAKSLTSAVMDERQNIVREIHDSIGQNISYLHHKLASLASSEILDPKTVRELEQAQRAADEAYRQIRGTLLKLDIDTSTDLASTIADQAREIGRRSNFKVEFEQWGSPVSLPLNTQLMIIHIFREALINVEKHASARKVFVRVRWSGDELSVQLVDEGRGFDPSAVLPGAQFGLKIMRERARDIDADFVVLSRPGSGTDVTLRIHLLDID